MKTFTIRLGQVITVRDQIFKLVSNTGDQIYLLNTRNNKLGKPIVSAGDTHDLNLLNIQCMLPFNYIIEAEEIKFQGSCPLVEEFNIGDTILIDGLREYRLALVSSNTFVLLDTNTLSRWSDAIKFGNANIVSLSKAQVERLVNGLAGECCILPKQWRKVEK